MSQTIAWSTFRKHGRFGRSLRKLFRAHLPNVLRQNRAFNLLAFKISLAVVVVLAVLLVGARQFLFPIPLEGILFFPLAAGLAGYLASHVLLTERINLARNTLVQIRNHQFENLEAAHLPGGDELNELIWQVYRTGLALEKEIKELKKVENYRREFLGNVSHELKTPIFSVQGFAETLLEGALDDSQVNRKFVEKILRNAHRLNNLTRDLSEISRIETGELKMTMAPFNLKRLVQEVAEALELAAKSRQISLTHHLPDTLPSAYGDRERIRQVLTNLVDNAIKYNNPGGYVNVQVRLLPSSEISVHVEDNGIGVAPQDIPRLTERFYRVDKSRSRDQGGTGLGLSIIKHILAAHDRKLIIDSTVGRGSTFGFTLPCSGAVV